MGLSEGVFDTNILIDFLREVPGAQAELTGYTNCYISQITWIEVMAGIQPHEDAKVRSFLSGFEVLSISERVIEEAVIVRREGRLKLPDAIILATAIAHNLILVTRNTRDFPTGPRIRVPYQL